MRGGLCGMENETENAFHFIIILKLFINKTKERSCINECLLEVDRTKLENPKE